MPDKNLDGLMFGMSRWDETMHWETLASSRGKVESDDLA